jgi:hypothetical protein
LITFGKRPFTRMFSVLGHIPLSSVDQQLSFKEFCYLHHGVIVFTGRLTKFPRIDRNAGVDVVMKGQDMALVKEVPHQRIEVIRLLRKFDVEVVGENVSDFIKALQAAIIVDNCLCASEIGAKG